MHLRSVWAHFFKVKHMFPFEMKDRHHKLVVGEIESVVFTFNRLHVDYLKDASLNQQAQVQFPFFILSASARLIKSIDEFKSRKFWSISYIQLVKLGDVLRMLPRTFLVSGLNAFPARLPG